MAKTIITLSREYCTGGRFIAQDVADALGVKLYDKELITMAARDSGLSEEAVAASEKRHTHSLLYSLYTMGTDLPLSDQVFILQSRIIKKLAEEGPCVILGRCANYLLMDRPNVLRVFIHAPLEARLARVASYSLAWSQREVARHIRVEDHRRAAYYHYYTGEEWRDAAGYDLSLDSEKLGEDGCVEFIRNALPLFIK